MDNMSLTREQVQDISHAIFHLDKVIQNAKCALIGLYICFGMSIMHFIYNYQLHKAFSGKWDIFYACVIVFAIPFITMAIFLSRDSKYRKSILIRILNHKFFEK